MSAFEKGVVGVTTWLMAITGAAYFYMKYLMTGDDPFSILHHPWQPHALSLHVIVGPLAVFALGLIARDHIIDRLLEPRRRAGRVTGIAILVLTVPMVASGYLMQVLNDPGIKRVLMGTHVVSGTIYTLLFAGHLFASRSVRVAANGNGKSGVRPRASRARHSLDRQIRGV